MQQPSFSPFNPVEKARFEAAFSTFTDRTVRLDDADVQSVQLLQHVVTEGLELDLNRLRPEWAGRKVAVQVLGAFAANDVLHALTTITVSIPTRVSVAFLSAFFNGWNSIWPEAYALKVSVKAGPSVLSAAVASLVYPAQSVLQSQEPQPGDVLCLTGEAGSAYAGLRVLQHFVKDGADQSEVQANLAGFDDAIRQYAYPDDPRGFRASVYESGVTLSSCRFVIESIQEEVRALRNPGIDLTLDIGALPVRDHLFRAAKLLGEDAFTWALQGGEDHQFLFSIAQEDVELLRNIYPEFRVIGTVNAGNGGVFVTNPDGNQFTSL
jgi:thiamine-monophosphate kinase